MSFQNKVVIVTGASSGIGAATAKLFAKEKAKVVLVGRNTEKLNKVEADIKKYSTTNPLVIKADVSNEVEARGIVDKTIAQFDKLDVLINNAGVGATTSIFSEEYIKDFDKIYALNLRGVAVITKAAVPHLVKTKGNIVNISSVAGHVASPDRSIYGSSKAALDHWSRCLALELASHGVRVNIVSPGPVETDFTINRGLTKEQSDAFYRELTNKTPLNRISQSEEIADVILFLANEKAKSITGSLYAIDCGLALSPKIPNNNNK